MASFRFRWHTFKRFFGERLSHVDAYGLGLFAVFVGIAACLWVFLVILQNVASLSTLYSVDVAIRTLVREQLSEAAVGPIRFITDLGGTRGTVLSALPLALFLLARRWWWDLFRLLLASGLGGAVLLGLKLLFQRLRPPDGWIAAGGFSYPSGHAFAAFVFWGFVIYLAWRHRLPGALRWTIISVAALMILLIGVSRVLLGVHWLTDVAGGYAAGFAWLASCLLLVHFIERPRRR